MSVEGDYSQVADAQLDALENGPDVDLYNSVLDTIEFIFRLPGQAQSLSTAITTPGGIRMRLPVTASHLDQPDPAPQPREKPARAEGAGQREQDHRPNRSRPAHKPGRKGPHGKPAGRPHEESGGENRHALPRQLMDKPAAKKPFRNRKRRGNFRRQASNAA